jgi:hypothetical protein
MRVAVAFDHAVRRAALAACLSSDDTSVTALAERSQRWPRGREQMRRRGVATVAATAGSSQPIKAQSLVSVLIYQSETRSPTRYDVCRQRCPAGPTQDRDFPNVTIYSRATTVSRSRSCCPAARLVGPRSSRPPHARSTARYGTGGRRCRGPRVYSRKRPCNGLAWWL